MLADVLPREAFALTLQNGIGNVEALAAALGEGRVMAGNTYNSGARLGPARSRTPMSARPRSARSTAARRSGSRRSRRCSRRRGCRSTVTDNVMGHVWMKFVLNVAINPVSAVTGLRSGQIARTPSALALMEHILDEVLAVMAAKGIRLPYDDPRAYVIDHAWVRYNRPSMLQHVEAGRRTEIDTLNGALLREAKALGIPCPFNEAIVLVVKALEARAVFRGGVAGDRRGGAGGGGRATPRPAGLEPAMLSAARTGCSRGRGRRCG